ncbi:MAG: hypothetical protein RBQ88_12445, partial [Desulfobulbus oligotrophicus]|nr:hypothetical protein [Desulfobulbus oligotrophicus]
PQLDQAVMKIQSSFTPSLQKRTNTLPPHSPFYQNLNQTQRPEPVSAFRNVLILENDLLEWR